MWLEDQPESPDEAWFFSGRDFDRAWTFMVAATGSREAGHTVWCKLLSPDMTHSWTETGIETSDSCAAAVSRMFFRVTEDGRAPPDVQELLSMLPEGRVEARIETLRTNPLPVR